MADATEHPTLGHVRHVTVVRRHDCPHGRQAVVAVKGLADRLAIPIQLEDVVVQTDDEAHLRQCLGSPTVLVAGRDAEPSARERTSFGVT